MKARDLASKLLGLLALVTLASAGARGDVMLSVVDATPTARNDGTLPGIGETIFSADVHVEVTPDDFWAASGIGMVHQTLRPNVFFYYTHDPNTGDAILTAPGYGNDAKEFSTFVSFPREQTQRQRFTVPAEFRGSYWGGPSEVAEPDFLSVAYWQPPPPTWGSGYTQRVTIDIAESEYAGRQVYPARIGAADPRHELLVMFESNAHTWDGLIRFYHWGFYAVPEPPSASLLLFAIAVASSPLKNPLTGMR